MRDINRNPRRWGDAVGRVRVIEGWHPSEPGRVGYNLIVEGDWVGTFGTLDDAAAAAHTDHGARGIALRPCQDRSGRGGKSRDAGLHLVEPLPDED